MTNDTVTKDYVDAIASGTNFRNINIDEDCLNGIGVSDGDIFYLDNNITIIRMGRKWYRFTDTADCESPPAIKYDNLTEEAKIGYINSSQLVDCQNGYKFFNEYVLEYDKEFYRKYKLLFK